MSVQVMQEGSPLVLSCTSVKFNRNTWTVRSRIWNILISADFIRLTYFDLHVRVGQVCTAVVNSRAQLETYKKTLWHYFPHNLLQPSTACLVLEAFYLL